MIKYLDKNIILQITRFVFVGGVNAVLSYSIFLLSVYFFNLHYAFALVIGYIFGIINSYVLNSRFTFNAKRQHTETFGKFVMVYIMIFFLNYILLYIFIDYILWNPAISQIVALSITVPTTFISHKYWSFR